MTSEDIKHQLIKKHGVELLANTMSLNIHVYKDTYRLILTTPVCLAELLTVYKPTHHLCSSSDTSVLSLPSVHMHSLGRRSFLMLHHRSGNSLARLDHQTYSPLLNIFEILPLKLSYWLCVCMLAEVCFDCALFFAMWWAVCSNWRNSTWKSASLLSVVCVLKYIYIHICLECIWDEIIYKIKADKVEFVEVFVKAFVWYWIRIILFCDC